MRSAVKSIEKLWVNGKVARGVVASLELSPGRFRVRARLGRYSPFQQRFALSLQLPDGRIGHGQAMLVEADGDDVLFEGEVLEGGAAQLDEPDGGGRPVTGRHDGAGDDGGGVDERERAP